MFPVVDNAAEADVDIAGLRGVEGLADRMLELRGCLNHYKLMERYTSVDMSRTPAALAAAGSAARAVRYLLDPQFFADIRSNE